MSRLRLWCVCVLLSSLSVVAAPAAVAQSTRSQSAVPTPQQLNPSALAPQKARPRSNDIFAPPEPGPCPLRDSPLTFTLKGVTLSGAVGANGDKLTGAYKEMIGQTIPVSAICEIRDRATAILFSQGILARVEIPEQTIASGQLQLIVIEARIASIHFHGDAGPAEAKVEQYLEQLRGLTPFNLNVAQRYLLLAADVPGVLISAAIRPSPEGRGSVDLDVTISHKVEDAAFNVENFGSETEGPWAALASVDLKGLTSFGDRSALVLYSTTDGREQRIIQLVEEIRPTGTGLILRGSASYANTKPGGFLALDGIHGDSLDVEVSASYPVIRRRRDNLNLTGGFVYVDENTDLNGGSLFNDKLRIFYLRADANARGAVFGMPFEGALGLEVRRGVDGLGASMKGSTDLSRPSGVPDATIERVDGHASLDLTDWLQFYVGMQYQYSQAPLLSYEQVAIGNLTIGRGYDPSSVAGDRGGAVALEPRLGPFRLPFGLQASTYAFYDIGYAEYVDTHEAATVRSAGGGFRLTTPVGVDINLFYAQPFDKPSFTATGTPSPRLMFALTYRQ